jgi:hypothetical protein
MYERKQPSSLGLAGFFAMNLLAACAGSDAMPPAHTPTFESRLPAFAPPSAEPEHTVAVGRMSASELCDQLTRDAEVEVAPIYRGAQVSIVPARADDLDRIRSAAMELERRLEHVPGAQPELAATDVGVACGLDGLRRADASMLVIESDGVIKLIVTAADDDRANAVLDHARRMSLR